MLQHNVTRIGCQVAARGGASNKAHLAHAAVAGMHALCCGLPAAAMLAAAASNASVGIVAVAGQLRAFHAVAHHYEFWILAVSSILVSLGGVLEYRARRRGAAHGFPWLFALSVSCFLFNATVIGLHRVL
jgi:hypothetical protein